jgi:hypothetical protein
MKPSIGRIVHLNLSQPDRETYGQDFCAAVITTVLENDMVNLSVFMPSALAPRGKGYTMPLENVAHAPNDKPTPNHWNWPPRDERPAGDVHIHGGRVTVQG